MDVVFAMCALQSTSSNYFPAVLSAAGGAGGLDGSPASSLQKETNIHNFVIIFEMYSRSLWPGEAQGSAGLQPQPRTARRLQVPSRCGKPVDGITTAL